MRERERESLGYNENDEDQKDNESKRRGRNHKNIKSNQLKKKTFSIFVFLNKKNLQNRKFVWEFAWTTSP